MSLADEPFSVADVIETCLALAWPSARAKGILLTCSVPELLRQHTVQGDALRLRQVVVHLLSNAIKFSNSGTVEVAVQAAQEAGDSAAITVQVCLPKKHTLWPVCLQFCGKALTKLHW